MKNILLLLLSSSLAFSQISVIGELSTDINTAEDASTFTSTYTGVTFADSTSNWQLSANMNEGALNVEEAWYKWNVGGENFSLTFGSQPEPYGIVWGLHRPSNNKFVSVPRTHDVYDGLGIAGNWSGVGVNAFMGNDDYWAARVSYAASVGVDISTGISTNSNDNMLIDGTINGTIASTAIATSLEYDLSEEADGAYWVRSSIEPSMLMGAFVTIGYNSVSEASVYGVGYNCTDNFFITSEMSEDSDIMFRMSYSFK